MATYTSCAQVALICDYCSQPTKQVCSSCEKNVCLDCTEKHQCVSLEHDVANSKDKKSLDDCKYHPGVKYVFHCQICNTKICNDCLSGPNLRHNPKRTESQDEGKPWILDVVKDKSMDYWELSALRYLFHTASEDTLLSFAKSILNEEFVEKLLKPIVNLSSKVLLKRCIGDNNTKKEKEEKDEPGTIYVFEVEVISIENKLCVVEMDCSQRERFFDHSLNYATRVIWIYSKSIRVIEAKLQVFRDYETLLRFEDIFLHHAFEDPGEICNHSKGHQLRYISKYILAIKDNVPENSLKTFLQKATEEELSLRNITEICCQVDLYDGDLHIGTAESPSYRCFSYFKVLRLRNALIEGTVNKILKSLEMDLQKQILNLIDLKSKQNINTTFPGLEISAFVETHPNIEISTKVLVKSISRHLSKVTIATLAHTLDVNSRQWRGQLASEIHECLSKENLLMVDLLLPGLQEMCNQTKNDLWTISNCIDDYKNKLELVDQKSLIIEWEKRQLIADRKNFMDSFPSVLTYIAGRENDAYVVKVFLKEEDTDAEKTFRKSCLLTDKECTFQFINVAAKKKEILTNLQERPVKEYKPFEEEKRLKGILKDHRKRLMANYSNIVGISLGIMSDEPCIVLRCLAKNLVPFGEQKLPETLEGYPVDIREDFIMFDHCTENHLLQSGCSIGIPSVDKAGSVGFFVKLKNPSSLSSKTGFLTEAHVALERFTELCDTNTFLSRHPLSRYIHNIVHPSKKDSNTTKTIGEVCEAFCGNCETTDIGIDAAYVTTNEEEIEHFEVRLANEQDLKFNGTMYVTKIGRTTGRTTGLLSRENESISIPNRNVDGGFCEFEDCYSVENGNPNSPFFDLGDSGSGVFLLDNSGNPNKALGIAFVTGCEKTYVCKLKEIVKQFNLSVGSDEEPMDES